jgi:hypothetical protein
MTDWGSPSEMTRSTALEMADALRSGAVTSVALTQAHLGLSKRRAHHVGAVHVAHRDRVGGGWDVGGRDFGHERDGVDDGCKLS